MNVSLMVSGSGTRHVLRHSRCRPCILCSIWHSTIYAVLGQNVKFSSPTNGTIFHIVDIDGLGILGHHHTHHRVTAPFIIADIHIIQLGRKVFNIVIAPAIRFFGQIIIAMTLGRGRCHPVNHKAVVSTIPIGLNHTHIVAVDRYRGCIQL